MATAKAKLLELSEEYIAELICDCTRFLSNPLKKVILIEFETNSLLWKILMIKKILHSLQGDLKLHYGDVKNQMFLRWTQFRSVADTLEILPDLPNLVVFEFDKTTTDEHDVDIFKKLVQRLSLGAHKKIMVMTKKIGVLRSVFENIDTNILCMLEEEDEVIIMEGNFNSALKLMPKTKNLFEAVSQGNLKEVVFFIESGANVDQTGDWRYNTPLHKAAEKGYTAVVLKLLQHRAKHLQNSNEDTPLHLAAVNGHYETVVIFLDHDIDVSVRDCRDNTPLHKAAEKGHTDVVLKLLQHRAKHLQNSNGDTPLHLAAVNGHYETVVIFLDHDIDVNVRGRYGHTPLHYSSEKGHNVILKTLIEYGADIEAEDNYKRTGLHLATWLGPKITVKTLLDYGAQTNAQDFNGWTPLHFAVLHNHLEIVKTLVEQTNTNLNSRNRDGETPLDTAKSRGHSAIVEYLTLQKPII